MLIKEGSWSARRRKGRLQQTTNKGWETQTRVSKQPESSEKNSITIVNRTNKWVNSLDELEPSQKESCRSNVQKMKLPIYQKLHQAKRHSIVREVAYWRRLDHSHRREASPSCPKRVVLNNQILIDTKMGTTTRSKVLQRQK